MFSQFSLSNVTAFQLAYTFISRDLLKLILCGFNSVTVSLTEIFKPQLFPVFICSIFQEEIYINKYANTAYIFPIIFFF